MRRATAVLALLAVVVFGAAVRIGVGLGDERFDTASAVPMLKSDPALLYYLVERILESGGGAPADFRADPRIAHPEPSDVPAMFTVGQEFLVAWSYRVLGFGLPLHVFCVILMAVVASLAALGIAGLCFELTRDVRWACLGGVLFALSPANYRTVGFILVREDLSLPWFALHLYLVIRAGRLGTPGAYAMAGLALLLALASWHGMVFVAALEAACVFAWFLRSGTNPLICPESSRRAGGWAGSWALVLVLALGAVAVPVLRAKLFVLSIPMQLCFAMGAVTILERRTALGRGARVAAAGAAWLLLFAASLAMGASDDYTHVFQLVASKLRFLGSLPDDPAALPFGARLLWQGPFANGSVAELVVGLLLGSFLLPVALLQAVPGWWRGRGDARYLVLVALAVGCAVLAVLVQRNLALVGLLTPAVCVVALRDARLSSTWLAGLVAAQVIGFAGVMERRELHWYYPVQQAEIATLVDWTDEHLARGTPIATDYINSTALLVSGRHPMLLQPKYETRASRDRIETFLDTFFHNSVDDFHALLERHGFPYVLIDTQTLWQMRYTAGLALSLERPHPGTAASVFLNATPGVFDRARGFRLLYRSPYPSDMMRLYAVELD